MFLISYAVSGVVLSSTIKKKSYRCSLLLYIIMYCRPKDWSTYRLIKRELVWFAVDLIIFDIKCWEVLKSSYYIDTKVRVYLQNRPRVFNKPFLSSGICLFPCTSLL